MKDYEVKRNQIIQFLDQNQISAFDLVKIGKDLCCCGTCRFFVTHYLKDGRETDFGHCIKAKIPKQTRKFDRCCGSWELEDESEGEHNG